MPQHGTTTQVGRSKEESKLIQWHRRAPAPALCLCHCGQALLQLSTTVPVAHSAGAGHSPSRESHSGLEELPLFCTKISQGQKPPSLFSPRSRALALSQITLARSEGWQSPALRAGHSHLHGLFLFCRALHPPIHPAKPLTDKVEARLASELGAHRGIWCYLRNFYRFLNSMLLRIIFFSTVFIEGKT